MDEQKEPKRQAQSRRGALLSATPCSPKVRGVQIAYRASNQAVDRYSNAIDGQLFQQWPSISIVALSIRGTRLDKQKHDQKGIDGPGGQGTYFLYQKGSFPKYSSMVCGDMAPIAPSCRHGRRAAIIATRPIRSLASTKQIALPQNRTYDPPYKPQNRTRGRFRRPQNRTYKGLNCSFLCPKTVHPLDSHLY